MSNWVNFTLSLPLCYSLKIRSYGMTEIKIFCIYGCFSVSRYIKGSRKSIFRHNWIFRHSCMYKQPTLIKWWNYSISVQILYRYFRYTDWFFLACALFIGHYNIIRASWETKMERLGYRKMCIKEFVWGKSLSWLYALPSMSVLLLSSSTPSPFPSGGLAEWSI